MAIWVNKSAQAVAAMQGILRIGAAYVPVDPMSPPTRAATIMRDCRVRALVAPAERARAVLNGDLATVPLLDTDSAIAMPRPESNPRDRASRPSAASDDDLAYILYTSGSTGIPKGVCISHRNALAFIAWAARTVGARAEDRFSNHAPFHFDLSVFDLYAAFLAGGCVAIVPESEAYLPAKLVDFAVDEGITVWYSVPSALTLMVDEGRLLTQSHLPLRAVVFAGEPYPIKQLRQLRDGLPRVRMFNWYGPTETNVCTSYEVRAIAADRTIAIPIGSAASGDRVWAVKDDGSEAGIGEQGELLVSGPTVALGYWGGEPQGTKPYRTGDIVRLDADGEYVFIGRRDNMLKIRGNRVEPGEIEAALLAHPSVAEAAVVAGGTGMRARLIAFLTARSEPPALLEMKRHCAGLVPRHMIIDHVVFLAELPRTGNGKIDRVRLKRMAEEAVGEVRSK